MQKLRAAIIGTGFAGQVHARALRLLGIPVAGVVASTPERSAAAAREFGVERTYPDDFRDYNARMVQPGGFYRGNGAHERIWKTPAGRAVFTTPDRLNALGFDDAPGRFRLITMRSNDQFNTTIYGYSDRLRGLEGSRDILLMCPDDISDAGLVDGQRVTVVTDVVDGHDRRLTGLTLTAFQLPRGTIAGYYPECNVLVPIDHHDRLSKTPASKSVPVFVVAG